LVKDSFDWTFSLPHAGYFTFTSECALNGKGGVSSYRKESQFIIDVSDHGCGIPLDKRESILAPFFSTKREGTGLGLPIAKKIVEAHGGHMEVADNLEKGITSKQHPKAGDSLYQIRSCIQ